ncbi:hypothetical protein LC040_02545 [Bacillus tianshenii]|nr:hypothetical protein LC040_02545 [Bacillus tianshenii]
MMNNLRSLFGRGQMFNFGRRRTRGGLWFTLLGMGISAVATRMMRDGNNNNMMRPMRNMAENVQHSVNNFTNDSQMRPAQATEFAEELTPKKDKK